MWRTGESRSGRSKKPENERAHQPFDHQPCVRNVRISDASIEIKQRPKRHANHTESCAGGKENPKRFLAEAFHCHRKETQTFRQSPSSGPRSVTLIVHVKWNVCSSVPARFYSLARERGKRRDKSDRNNLRAPLVFTISVRCGNLCYNFRYARVAELADAPDLGSGGETRRGSSPLSGTLPEERNAERRIQTARSSAFDVRRWGPRLLQTICQLGLPLRSVSQSRNPPR